MEEGVTIAMTPSLVLLISATPKRATNANETMRE